MSFNAMVKIWKGCVVGYTLEDKIISPPYKKYAFSQIFHIYLKKILSFSYTTFVRVLNV